MSSSKSKGFGSGKTGFGSGKTGFGGGKSANGGTEFPYTNPHKDPLEGIVDTDDLEKDLNAVAEKMGEAYSGFVERSKAEQSRFKFAVDAGFWAGMCFKSKDDLQAFLDAIGMGYRLYDGLHIDGYELADKLGVKVDFKDRNR